MAESSTKVGKEQVKSMTKTVLKGHKIQIQVNYTKTPPQAFLSKLRKLVSEYSSEKCMEDFHISLEWAEDQRPDQQPTPKRKRKLGVGQSYRMCDLR